VDLSFSRLWDGYTTDAEAKSARNCKLRSLRLEGKMVRGWCLRNQIKKYNGFGQPNGDSCHIYKISGETTT